MTATTIDLTPQGPVNVTPLKRDEARALTDEIKVDLERVGDKLLEAYRRQAWKALCYQNYVDYAQVEFGKSKSDAYRLLDAARVTHSLFPEFGKEVVELPIASKELLLKLPSDDRADALREAKALSGGKRPTAKHVRQVLEQRLNLPPKPSKEPVNNSQSLGWHRSEWCNESEFEISINDVPLRVEYLAADRAYFNFYDAEGDEEILKCVAITKEDATAWSTPSVAAVYLSRKHLARWLLKASAEEPSSELLDLRADWERKDAALNAALDKIESLQAELKTQRAVLSGLQAENLQLSSKAKESVSFDVGSVVGKRLEGWRGEIRSLGNKYAKVWWIGDYVGKGKNREEKLTNHRLAELCLFPVDLVDSEPAQG